MATAPPQISVASTEYIHTDVTSDVILDAQPVDMVLLAGTAKPDSATTWLPAEWEGTAGTTRTARLLVGPGGAVTMPAGAASLWVRVTDTPEVPVRQAGTLTFV